MAPIPTRERIVQFFGGEMDEDEFEVVSDLYDRKQRIIDHQIDAVRLFGDRGMKMLQVIMIYSGLVITVVSVIYRQGRIENVPAVNTSLIVFLFGALALTVSTLYSIRLLLGGLTRYGHLPQETIDKSGYGKLNENYEAAIEQNIRVLRGKQQSFRRSLSSLIVGLMGTGVSLVFLIFRVAVETQVLVFLSLFLTIGYVINKILRGEFTEISESTTPHG